MFHQGHLAPAVRLIGLMALLVRPSFAGTPSGAAAVEPARRDSQRSISAPLAPSQALVENVKGVLDEGYQTGARRLQGAQKKLASARNLTGDDWRLDYAYGLVLLKHSQNKKAIAQFESAIQRADSPYWPAWKALIWTQIVEKQYAKGLDRLDEFATIVRKGADPAKLTDPQRDAARWMGQILEALDKTVKVKRLHELVEEHDRHLHELLGDELYSTVRLGRDLVGDREADGKKSGDGARSAGKSRTQRPPKTAAKNDNDSKDRDKEQTEEPPAGTPKGSKTPFDETLVESDKELARLDKEYRLLETRNETLQRLITQIGRELSALELQMNAIGATGLSGTASVQIQQRMVQRQKQLANCQVEYNATVGRMTQTAEQGRAAFQQRMAIVETHEKETGQFVEKKFIPDNWSARVTNGKTKLEVPTADKGKTPRTAIARRAAASLASIVPLDLDDEKTRVLAMIGATK
jgi:tetratricopeptide (TPR) repeat protein